MKTITKNTLYGLLITFLFLVYGEAKAQDYYVDANATGTNVGTSWTNAFTSLQSALAVATSGKVIWVADGTYKPTNQIDINGNGSTVRDATFQIPSGVSVYGGFAGGETLLSQRNPTTNVAILSGDIGTIGDNTDNTLHVLYTVDASTSTILDGFTVKLGNATEPGANNTGARAGAWYNSCSGASVSSPTINNVIFENHTSLYMAGAIHNETGGSGSTNNPTYTNCIFRNNASGSGWNAGAIFNASYGGGEVSPTFINCLFYNNTASVHGGAMFNDGRFNGNSSPIITNCTFYNNTAGGSGGALYNQKDAGSGASNTQIRNSIFRGNTASSGGISWYNDNGTPTATNTLIQEASLPAGTTNGGSNIFNTNPLFTNTATNDFTLQSGSPALNVGNNTFNATSTDLAGNARIQNTTIDLGAYEFVTPIPSLTLSQATLSNFVAGSSTTSTSQSFTISGSHLTGDANLSLSTTDWELSTNNTTFTSTLTLTQSSGSLTGQPITVYVRIKSGLSLGSKTATLTASSSGATNQTITLNGNVINAVPNNVRGNMMNFNGTNSITTSIVSNATSNVTMEAWVRTTANTSGNTGVIYNGNAGANGYGFYTDVNGQLRILFGGFGLYDTGYILPVNTWQHIALVSSGTNWIVYANGVQVGSFTNTPSVPTGSCTIGAGSSAAEFYNGSIDEFRVWNTTRTQAQIRENMHLTLTGSESGLVAYYQFNETSGDAIDAVSGNNGTLINSPTRTASEVAVAGGTSSRMTVSNGLNTFVNSNLAINFTTAPADEFVAYLLRGNPVNGVNALNQGTNTTSCYWIVRQFGTNPVAYDQMNFTVPSSNTISTADETTPANLKLYKRADNSTAAFPASIASATSASNTTKVIQFTGLSQTSFSQFEIGSTSSPLPITLLSFEGKRKDNDNVNLTWKTATEINNKGFEIETSKNAVEFTKIAFVDGFGNSNTIKNYVLDTKNNEDSYYRLKQIDFNGSFSYSNIIFVKGSENNINIYPNPTSDNVTIELNNWKNGDTNAYELQDLQGKLLFKDTFKGNKTTINLANLSKGLYLLHITQNNKKIVRKIVIQ